MRDNPYHNTVILGGKIEVDYDLIQTLVSCMQYLRFMGSSKLSKSIGRLLDLQSYD